MKDCVADIETEQKITDLLTEFDEMGFAPTTLCPDPEQYAIDWREMVRKEFTRLTAENDNLTVELEVAQRDVENLTRTLEEANDEIKALEAENSELRATLSKMEKVENAVDLPCKVGDNIYVRYYNNKEKRHCVEVERVSKTNFNITNGILSGTVYTYDFSKRHEEDNCYNMRGYNKKWFTDRVAAEARLEELKGAKQ